MNNAGASSVAQLTSSEEGTQSGPAAEFGESSWIASIMISSFSMIYVKDNDLLMPGKEWNWVSNNVLGVWNGKNTSELVY